MPYSHTVRGVRHSFTDLRQVLAWATPARSGDELAGIAAPSAEQRAIAQMTLAEVPLSVFAEELVVAHESDAVSRLIVEAYAANAEAMRDVTGLTVGEFRDWLLSLRG